MTKGNKRLPHESQEAYHRRLRNEKFLIRGYLRGRRVWASSVYGTYTRKEHGEIGSGVRFREGYGLRRCK